jgi:hypothetical protein
MNVARQKLTVRNWILVVVFLPLGVAVGLVLFLCLPFYLLYRFALRVLVQLFWVARGKRILLVYSRSPVWQEYIESTWLPRLGEHAIVLNWSDRANWRSSWRLAALVFRVWAPSTGFNPMAILFPSFPRTQRIGFFYAFRDWKHGNEFALRAAEAQLFAFSDKLRTQDA